MGALIPLLGDRPWALVYGAVVAGILAVWAAALARLSPKRISKVAGMAVAALTAFSFLYYLLGLSGGFTHFAGMEEARHGDIVAARMWFERHQHQYSDAWLEMPYGSRMGFAGVVADQRVAEFWTLGGLAVDQDDYPAAIRYYAALAAAARETGDLENARQAEAMVQAIKRKLGE